MENLVGIVKKFAIEGDIKDIKPLGNGLINDTYKVTTKGNGDDYVLQRINNAVFTDVDLLQSNIEAVTRHIRKKLEACGEKDIKRRVLRFIPLKSEGEKLDVLISENPKTYYFDGQKYWRVSLFIPDAYTYETVNPHYSEMAGEAFGNFEAMLTDLPDKLGETIPDFPRRTKLEGFTRITILRARSCTRFFPKLTNMERRCARLSSCIVKASFQNEYATVTRKLTT